MVRTVKKKSGSVLLSHSSSTAVPSALKGLTSVFGMGTGRTPSISPPQSSGATAPDLATYFVFARSPSSRTNQVRSGGSLTQASYLAKSETADPTCNIKFLI